MQSQIPSDMHWPAVCGKSTQYTGKDNGFM